MFLSRRSNGVYYLWFDDELGRRHKVPTRCTLKTDALKFIQQFKQAEKQKKINRVLLSQFTETFLPYSKNVHSHSTQVLFRWSFQEFRKIVGDLLLHRIGVREIEQFLATKIRETSAQPLYINRMSYSGGYRLLAVPDVRRDYYDNFLTPL